jgi:hypothetical protein
MKKSLHQFGIKFSHLFTTSFGLLSKRAIPSVLPIILMLLVLSFTSKVSMAQTQLGTDIDGEADYDNSGYSVSLSSDGQTVAIGAIGNVGGGGSYRGHVRVYKLISGTWTLQGADIDGEASNDQSGYSLSLSSDGQTVAIGAIYNTGGGSNRGHVRVYKLISGTWTLQGTDIDGEANNDQSGRSVSLSSDGQTVAIGAPYNAGGGTYRGHVRVYKLISGTWTLQGTDIDGEANNDYSGTSVSLSSDGQTVAIGAHGNDGTGSDAGHVRVYKLISGTWTLQGTDIDGEANNDYSGYSVSLSSDGQTVAIGAYSNVGGGSYRGHVRVYQLISGTWTLQGADIDGEANNDYSGYSVSLASDGQTVAIGALYNDGGGSDRGHVRVYKLISGTWTLQGADIDGEANYDQSGYSVSLSSDGQTVAIGAVSNAGGGTSRGHVRVYQMTSPVSIASYSQTNIACSGSTSGTATVSATSGTAPYTYSWSPSGGTNATATNLAAGNYTVTVTDAASSSATQTFTIVTTTEYTYTGTSPDDWLDEGNWSPCYPGTTIASGTIITVSPGSTLVIPTGTTITNEGTILNNGTLTLSGGTFDNSSGTYSGSGAYTGGVFVNPVGGTVNPGQ